MNYYEHHLGDYAKDTGHLTIMEHGAYRLLLDRYYSTEEGIPAAQAYRLARARSDEERHAVDVVLEEYFDLVDGVWINGRAEEEIERARAKIGASRENGKKGGRPKKYVGSDSETQQKPSGLFPGSDSETQQKAHQAPDTRHQTPGLTASGVPDSNETVQKTEKQLALQSANEISQTARVCLGLKAMGYGDTNPHDPKLQALLDAGLTTDEIISAGQSGKGLGKGFRWVLATAEGRRRDAANVKPMPDKQPNSSGLSKAGQKTAEAAARWLESQGVQS